MRRHIATTLLIAFAMLGAWVGGASGEIGDAEAVALELSGELLAPPALTAQVAPHLAAIRAHDPFLQDIHARLPWMPGEILVRLSDSALAEYLDGSYTGFDALDALYGPLSSDRQLFGNVVHREFVAYYNSSLLADLYESAPGVEYAEPNFLMGDGSDIWAEELGIYTFKYGSGDCLSGCMYEHYWTYQVLASGEVVLLAEWSFGVSGADGPPALSAAISLQNHPNPFNPRTNISYELRAPAHVRLVIHDLMGRMVRVLVDRDEGIGPHSVPWDGRDASGRSVASGIYICALDDGEQVLTRKLALVR